MTHTSYSRRAKKDAIHDEACKFLHDVGFSVFDSHKVGGGFGDAVVGAADVNDILEFKTGNAPYTDDQIEFHRTWRGRKPVTLRSMAEVKEWVLRVLHERRRQPERRMLIGVVP